MELKTSFAGMALEHPLVIAAGMIKTLDHVHEAAKAPTAAVMVGSITMAERAGNSGDVYWQDPDGVFTLNSLGLPNPGKDYYQKHLPTMVQVAHDANKPLIVSVAGFSPAQYAELSSMALESGADAVELNLGCPNVWGAGEQKPIPSYNPELTGEILNEVARVVDPKSVIIVKLSPIGYDSLLVKAIAKQLNQDFIKGVTCSNIGPNGFAYVGTSSMPAINAIGDNDTRVVYGGIAGRALKPWSMGLIHQLTSENPGR